MKLISFTANGPAPHGGESGTAVFTLDRHGERELAAWRREDGSVVVFGLAIRFRNGSKIWNGSAIVSPIGEIEIVGGRSQNNARSAAQEAARGRAVVGFFADVSEERKTKANGYVVKPATEKDRAPAAQGDALDAPPSADEISALRTFAANHGRAWKDELNNAWRDGRDANEPLGSVLRRIRNTRGPSWLVDFKLPAL